MDLLGDIGGVLEVFTMFFGFFVFPLAEHKFIKKAIKKLYFAKTENKNLFKKGSKT